MQKKRRLVDEYRFPGFHLKADIQGIFGDFKARVIRLHRCQKKQHVVAVGLITEAFTIGRSDEFGICLAARHGFIWRWRFDVYFAGGARR